MIDNELLKQNEVEVNRQNRQIFRLLFIICVIGCVVVLLTDDKRYLKLDILDTVFLLCSFSLMAIINIHIPPESSRYKYIFLIWSLMPSIVQVILSLDYYWLAFSIPLMLSCRYYNKKLVITVSVITQLVINASSMGVVFIRPMLGYANATALFVPAGTTIASDGKWLSEIAADLIQSGTASRQQQFIDFYFSYVIYISIFYLAISICCLMITSREIKLLEQQSVIMDEKRKSDIKLSEAKYSVLVSQIQPHFIFNVLNSIIALCDIEPKKAEEMLMAFSGYLRHDIDSLSNEGLITFDSELKSVKNYVKLEQMRFKDRLNVEYDLKVKGFLIPPLTLQPLVENAVKHGICKKEGGGTLRISTEETGEFYKIRVEDNGIGFDSTDNEQNRRIGIGLDNVRERLKNRMNAQLSIESRLGYGTRIEISIPRKPQY